MWYNKLTAWVFLALHLLPSHLASQPKSGHYFPAEHCKSYIIINGRSNINQFHFIYDIKNIEICCPCYDKKDTGNFEFCIPIKDFKASNPLMYDDFMQLMKAPEFPGIKIYVPKSQMYKLTEKSFTPSFSISISFAGVTRTYRVNCSVVNCYEKKVLCGAQEIRLTDFKLKPPEKFNGLIKVNNVIKVNFSFFVTFTDCNLTTILK